VTGKMTAAVLYGKEDIRLNDAHPAFGGRRSSGQGARGAHCGTDLKVYQRGYHARMIVPPALFGQRTSRHDRTGWRRRPRFQERHALVALNSAPCACVFMLQAQLNLCEICCSITARMRSTIRIPKRL